MSQIFSVRLHKNSRVAYIGYSLLVLLCAVMYVLLETPLVFALPVALLGIVAVVMIPKLFPALYFILLPFSLEVAITPSLGTDLPTEPLLLLNFGLAIVYMIAYPDKIKKSIFTHPISILLLAHVGWIFISAVTGTYPLIGVKFWAAKLWYIGALFLLPMLWFSVKEIISLIRYSIYALIPLAVWILFRHSQSGFGFEEANIVMNPFFRNHVVYAVYLLLIIPFAYLEWIDRKRKGKKSWIWLAIIAFLAIALYFNYTRIAHIGLVLLPAAYLILRFQLTRICLLGFIALVIGLSVWLTIDNKYMEIAPDYSTTVAHKNFEDLLSATLKGKDVSSMERVYRWVAAGFMIQDRPLSGFGPGSFYENYQTFTVYAFRTYVSDNPERSGIHNYFLMILVEQGVVGLLLFLALWIFALLRAEKLYHELEYPYEKTVAFVIYLTMISIGLVHLLNDLIETDKIGTFFFIGLALLVLLDENRRSLKA